MGNIVGLHNKNSNAASKRLWPYFKTTLGPLYGKLVLFYSLLQKCDLVQKYIDKFLQVMDVKCNNESLIQTTTGGMLIKLKKWKEASYFFQYTSR